MNAMSTGDLMRPCTSLMCRARGREWCSPWVPDTCSPPSLIAFTWSGHGSIKITSSPAAEINPPTKLPTAPAPTNTSRLLTCIPLPGCFSIRDHTIRKLWLTVRQYVDELPVRVTSIKPAHTPGLVRERINDLESGGTRPVVGLIDIVNFNR